MSHCDWEGPSLYATVEYRARKEYGCCECSQRIYPGERYLRVVGVWDGTFSTERQHLVCADLCRAVRDTDLADGCLDFGGFSDWWGEYGHFMDKKDPKVGKVRAAYAKRIRTHRATDRARNGTAR